MSPFYWESYREQYLYHLYRKGCPSSSGSLQDFIRTFFDNISLPQDQRLRLGAIIDDFHDSIQKFHPTQYEGRSEYYKHFMLLFLAFFSDSSTGITVLSFFERGCRAVDETLPFWPRPGNLHELTEAFRLSAQLFVFLRRRMRARHFDWDLGREQYLRRLYKKGYPPTNCRFEEFMKAFYKDADLQGERTKYAELVDLVSCFNGDHIQRNSIPRHMKGDRELEKMFAAVVADYEKIWKILSPVRKTSITSSFRQSNSTASSVAMEDAQGEGDAAQPNLELAKKQLMEKEHQLDDLKNAYAKLEAGHLKKINEMEKETAGQRKEVADLKKKNGDISKARKEEKDIAQQKNLAMAEECSQMYHQLEKEAAKDELDKGSLEEKVRSLEGDRPGEGSYAEDTFKNARDSSSLGYQQAASPVTLCSSHCFVKNCLRNAFPSDYLFI